MTIFAMGALSVFYLQFTSTLKAVWHYRHVYGCSKWPIHTGTSLHLQWDHWNHFLRLK